MKCSTKHENAIKGEASTKKTAEVKPEEAAKELIEAYPVKVGRKRAKQIIINEVGLEEQVPQVMANVRTIPGIITYARLFLRRKYQGRRARADKGYPADNARAYRVRLLQLAHPQEPDKARRR